MLLKTLEDRIYNQYFKYK